MLRVSIVAPSLNQGRFIERSILSVLNQEHPGLEYLVVDGGSTDETLSILRRYEGALRWVSEPDRGQADAVNKGLLAATGDVIGWLNSDDVYRPKAVETVCAFLAARPDIDVVYGEADLIDEHDQVLGRYYTRPWNRARLRDTDFLCQPAVFFRRRVIEHYGLLDDQLQYCMDYEYWLRLAFGGARFAYLQPILAGSRLYPSNKTLGDRLRVHREINRVLCSYYGRVPDRWVLNHAHTLIELDPKAHAAGRAVYVSRVARRALGLSLEWNHTVSPWLAMTALRMLAGALVKRGRR